MSCRIMLMKKTEMARMVAAAGFMLKQENIKARLMSVTASKVMNRCTAANLIQASEPSKVLTIRSMGKTTNKPPEGKKAQAARALKIPRETTRSNEKTAPESHLSRSSLSREIGRH